MRQSGDPDCRIFWFRQEQGCQKNAKVRGPGFSNFGALKFIVRIGNATSGLSHLRLFDPKRKDSKGNATIRGPGLSHFFGVRIPGRGRKATNAP